MSIFSAILIYRVENVLNCFMRTDCYHVCRLYRLCSAFTAIHTDQKLPCSHRQFKALSEVMQSIAKILIKFRHQLICIYHWHILQNLCFPGTAVMLFTTHSIVGLEPTAVPVKKIED